MAERREAIIEAMDLTKRYADGTLALDALNLTVPEGEIYCLLGANSAGKTTVIDLFLGFVRPTAGRALVCGFDVHRQPQDAKSRLAYLMGGAVLHDNLTATQNLALFARLGGHPDPDSAACAMALREVGLPERSFGQRVKTFDPGMRQKLALAAAIIKDTPVLLLDEPLAGLDPQTAAELVENLKTLRDRGRAILLATHDLFHAKQLADTVGILKEGRKVLSCSREELRYQDLEALYLDYMRGGLEPQRSDRGV